MKKLLLIFPICLLLLLAITLPVKASHIVGGEVYYKCLGEGVYNIELIIYQDCLEGELQAIQQDTPAYIGIFALNSLSGRVDTVWPAFTGRIVDTFRNDCVNNPPNTCLNKVSFTFDAQLKAHTSYRVVYMRCCRNASIQNIGQPGTTGATYYCDIPDVSVETCNNSARFKNFPPQIICVNNPLVYDHSATDADKDSLSYEFCEAYQGGAASINDPKPYNLTPNIPPPVNYTGIYSAAKPMGGNPVIQIDPKTGQITGTPNIQGRYVVTVCCHEWRKGKIINTIRREFQFNVTNCSKKVVADIPQFSSEFNTYIVQCSGNQINFVNHSSGGFKYKWYFRLPDTSSSTTSDQFEPSYTYPDTGIYTVKLIVNQNSTCPDSISRIVKIFPEFKTDFDINGLPCPNTPIQLTDKSVATFPPVVAWNWTFGDETSSGDANPLHTYAAGGNYNIRLISTSVKGCVDTLTKPFSVEYFKAFAGNDTIIVRGEYLDFRATGGVDYLWTPSDALNSAVIPNPRGYFPDTGKYVYVVHVRSAGGCKGDDSINVLVVPNPYLFVPSAFTPNRDGLNDFLKPLGAGFRNIRFFRIFNRWGQLVFQTTNFAEGWDGTLDGRVAEMGTYFWVLGVTDRFGQEQMIKGDVTLIR